MTQQFYRLQRVLWLTITLACFAAVSFSAPDVSHDSAKQGVVRVIAKSKKKDPSYGSGVIVKITKDRIGYIVTNYHVVQGYMDDDASITVEIHGHYPSANVHRLQRPGDKKEFAVSCIDLALLVTKEKLPQEDVKACYLADINEVRQAVDTSAPVIAFGHPGGDQLSHFPGRLNSVSGSDLLYKIDGDSELPVGNSGGPLMGSDGLVLGINKRYKFGFNRAIKADIVQSIVEGWGVELTGRPTPDNRAGIWIARIEGDENDRFRNGLIYEIETALSTGLPEHKFHIGLLSTTIKKDGWDGHNEARREGADVNATLIIWGKIAENSKGIYPAPRITVVKSSGISDPHRLSAKLPENITLPQRKVSKEAVLIVQYILAYLNFERGEYGTSLKDIEAIIREFDDINDKNKDEVGNEEFSFMGDVFFFSGKVRRCMSEQEKAKGHLRDAINDYKQARRCYKEADKKISHDDEKHQLRLDDLDHNLALAYLDLPDGLFQKRPLKWITGQKGNQQKAFKILQRTIDTHTQRKDYLRRIGAQYNLAYAYFRSGLYDKIIEAGESEYYKDLDTCAASMLFRINLPSDSMNLTSKKGKLFLRNAFENHKIALPPDATLAFIEKTEPQQFQIEKYQRRIFSINKQGDQLEVCEGPYPILCAMFKSILGYAYLQKGNLEKAQDVLEEGKQIIQQEPAPLIYADIQYHLGLTLFAKSTDSDMLKQAIDALSEAVKIYEDKSYSDDKETAQEQLEEACETLRTSYGEDYEGRSDFEGHNIGAPKGR